MEMDVIVGEQIKWSELYFLYGERPIDAQAIFSSLWKKNDRPEIIVACAPYFLGHNGVRHLQKL